MDAETGPTGGRPGARTWAGLAIVLAATMLLGVANCAGANGAGTELSLEAIDNQDLNVRLRWTMSDYSLVRSYLVFWDEERFDSIEGMEERSIQRGTTFLVPDLEENHRYYFAVAAVDANGTVLAVDYGSAVPTEPHLKQVNFWELMTVAGVVTAAFIIGLIKIPKMGRVR